MDKIEELLLEIKKIYKENGKVTYDLINSNNNIPSIETIFNILNIKSIKDLSIICGFKLTKKQENATASYNSKLNEKLNEKLKTEGYTLLSIYRSNNIVYLILKTIDEYIVLTRQNSFMHSTPRIFDKSNPYTIYNINKWLNKNNDNLICISETYDVSKHKLKFKCILDNKIFERSWDGLKATPYCPYCKGSASIVTKEDVLNLFNKFKITPLFDEYKGNCEKLIGLTDEGYKVVTTYASLKRGSLPLIFSISNPYTIQNIKLWISINNKNYELLSEKFVGAKYKLKFKCKKCKSIFNTRWNDIHSRDRGCPQCGIRRGSDNGCWKGGVSPIREYMRGVVVDWKKETIKKCNYKCDITNGNFDVVHHLYGFREIANETMKILNLELKESINEYSEVELELIANKCIELHYKYGLGVCLTKELHEEFHSIYGKGGNTPEQYIEFKINKLKAIN